MCAAALIAVSLNNVKSIDTDLSKQYTEKFFMRRAIDIVKKEPLYFFHSVDYGVIFYAGRHIHRYSPSVEPVSLPFYVLFWENEWKNIDKSEGLIVQATSESVDRQNRRRGHLSLVEVKDRRALASALTTFDAMVK